MSAEAPITKEDPQNSGSTPENFDFAKLQELVTEYALEYGLSIITALLVFIVGKWLCGVVMGFVKALMVKSKVEETLVEFLSNIVYWLLYLVVVIAALGQLGVETGSFIAIVGAAGLAVGLALQGSLANFASGVMIIIFRPFKVGDFVEAGGVAGVIKEIQIFNTVLTSPDNKVIFAPNASITGGSITNFSANDTRRVDLTFGVSYDDNLDDVKKMIEEVVSADERVLKDPEVTIAVGELADNSVNFVIRPWAKTADYWGVYFDLTEQLKKESDKRGFSIPFPQRDVHLYNESK